jgi:hypothetical protein
MAATSDFIRMMVSLFIINVDEFIFELITGAPFDLNQRMNGSEIFMSQKATLFSCLLDLGQMHPN